MAHVRRADRRWGEQLGDVVDGSVYKNSGLRAIGSYKLKKAARVLRARLPRSACAYSAPPRGHPVTYWPTRSMGTATSTQNTSTHRPHVLHSGRVSRAAASQHDPAAPHAVEKGDAALEDHLRGLMALTRPTSVRVSASRTPGFAPYKGAPGLGTYRIENKNGEIEVKLNKARSLSVGKFVAFRGETSALQREVQSFIRSATYPDGTLVWPRIEVSEPG